MDVSRWGGDGDGDDWEKEPWKKYQKENEKKVYNKERKALASSTEEDEQADKLLGTYHGFTVYIETHQGKHCVGAWPGYSPKGKQGPYFLNKMVSYNNQPLFHLLCNSAIFRDAVSPANADGQNGLLLFNFNKTVCGTNNQTGCQLQWKRSGTKIFIHGCPDQKGEQMGTYIDIKSLK